MAGHFRKPIHSMKGEIVDFSALAIRNANQVALGNAKMNAKGDLLGEGGTVLKTQEEVEAEWALKKAQSATIAADIKRDQMIPSAAKIQSDITNTTEFPSIQDLAAAGAIPGVTPKRNIVESDE